MFQQKPPYLSMLLEWSSISIASSSVTTYRSGEMIYWCYIARGDV
jgi:hypothetical protein